MKNQLATLLAKKEQELTALDSRRGVLLIEIRTLRDAAGLADTSPAPKADRASKAKVRGRAPSKALAQAIKGVIMGRQMTKRQVVEALKQSKYPYSLRVQHVAKQLGKLRDAGELAVDKKDMANVYSLKVA